MCKIFIGADPELYRSRSRSMRLHGVATSIRLENLFWQVLEEIGGRDGLSVALLITRLYDELSEAGGDCANFSSFLRVCCGRYLALQLAGRIPADADVPIRSLDADWVLAGEMQRDGTARRRRAVDIPQPIA
ncbi:MAG TPA: ribbon-helix-helix domain-containing protein [Rhodocyclaceae bacterium]|nr:ribbon-helix-helix domain-containing protein [Rhodocyclaceae bacterium]